MRPPLRHHALIDAIIPRMTNTATSKRRWWLIALCGLLTLAQAGAALRALRVPPELAAQISLWLPLEFVAGGLWALLFAVITANLLRKRAVQPAVFALGGFLIYSVIRLLLWAQADYDQNRLPFLVFMTICLLVFPLAALLRR